MSDASKPLDYATPPAATGQIESLIYTLMRLMLGGFGVMALAATFFASLDAWKMATDDGDSPPSTGNQSVYLLIGLGVGLLFVMANRWTQRPWLYWPRLVLHVAVGGWLVWVAIGGLRAGMGGGRSSLLYGVSLMFALMGIALVTCLIWSRRIYRDT